MEGGANGRIVESGIAHLSTNGANGNQLLNTGLKLIEGASFCPLGANGKGLTITINETPTSGDGIVPRNTNGAYVTLLISPTNYAASIPFAYELTGL